MIAGPAHHAFGFADVSAESGDIIAQGITADREKQIRFHHRQTVRLQKITQAFLILPLKILFFPVKINQFRIAFVCIHGSAQDNTLFKKSLVLSC